MNLPLVVMALLSPVGATAQKLFTDQGRLGIPVWVAALPGGAPDPPALIFYVEIITRESLSSWAVREGFGKRVALIQTHHLRGWPEGHLVLGQ